MKEDFGSYVHFHNRSSVDKALNTLLGIVLGIGLDGKINPVERGLFNAWLRENEGLCDKHPYSELIPLINRCIEDDVLDEEEREDIKWLCSKLTSQDYYNSITADIQVLHGILGGVASDGKVTKEELEALSDWLNDHEHLKTCYPYDEVEALLMSVLKDGQVDEAESKFLQAFFSEFLSVLDDKTITAPVAKVNSDIVGVCAVCPEIVFEGSSFCFTGESSKFKRSELAKLVATLGGKASAGVTKSVDYLVIGAEGNPCWVYACYGRKVEKAVELRKAGSKLLIIHENDFHDAVADFS